MLLALLLPVAPAVGATVEDEAGVRAANVLGTPTNPVGDPQDCLGGGTPQPGNVGMSRYFITVRSTSGLDITNAVGRIISSPGGQILIPGPLPGTVAPFGTSTVTMSNGDFESQANDGTQPACVPGVNDGHPNDLGSPPINTFPAVAPVSFTAIGGPAQGQPFYNMVITAAGFVPVVIPILADAGTACTPLGAPPLSGATNGIVCLISMGTVNMTPLSASAGRGTIAGSIFAPNGQPLDGAIVVATDASGIVHTRISGTDCDGRLVAPIGSPPTGFYCFSESQGDKPSAPALAPPTFAPLPAGAPAAAGVAPVSSPNGFANDSLGLPVGPATVTVVYDVGVNPLATFTNCPPPPTAGGGAPVIPGAPGSICGMLPNTVTVSVAAGTVVGQDITLQNKFAPAAGVCAPLTGGGAPAAGTGSSCGVVVPAQTTGANAFGYVVNGLGQGVGGIIITATTPAGAPILSPSGQPIIGVCPSPSTTNPLTPGISSPQPGSCTQTGLWVMTGLPAGTAVVFTITGAAINPQNVRPAIAQTRTTGAVGTWIDPNWIIVQAAPAPGFIPLPVVGSAIIRGTVTDAQGQPFTGAGGFVLLYRNSTRSFAASTVFAGTSPAVRGGAVLGGIPVGFFPFGAPISSIQSPVAAAALDAGGNYCFGSGSAPTAGTGVGCPNALVGAGVLTSQPPLLPDSYLVTVIDDRPTPACVSGFQPPAGGIGPAPCGNLPWTSQPVIAQADRVTTVNVQLQPKFAPGSPVPSPAGFPGVGGVFGILWDASVPGGRPVQGGTVYAVPVFCPAGGCVPNPAAAPLSAQIAALPATGGFPAATINPATLAGLHAGALGSGAANNAANALLAGLYGLVSQVPLTGQGVLSGGVISSTPAPGALGNFPYQNPTFPGSDQLGMYRILGLAPAATYAVIVEVPSGYNDCAPNDVQVGLPVSGSPFILSGILQPTGVVRCAVLVTIPAIGTPWAAGADFAFAGQNLSPLEPGEIDRRLQAMVPFVANGAPTAALGGWDLQTNEIRVVNGGAQRTVAEVRFYASDGLGGAAVLAGTQTADLVPGGARTFRSPEMPGGFLGWVGVWSFDADGPGGVYTVSELIVESMISARNAGNASEAMSGWARGEVISPATNSMIPLVYKNYGGTEDKWSTLLVANNLGDQAPVVFVFRSNDTTRGDARTCRIACTITRYAQRGGMITLNMGDTTDPDIALLPDGTFRVDITAGGPSPISGVQGILPGTVSPPIPGGYTALGIHLTVTGRMMTESRSQVRLSVAPSNLWIGSPDVESTGVLFAPLVFNNSNGWNSGIAISASQTTGSTAVSVTVTFHNEDGGFVGQVSNQMSSSNAAWYIYLPALQFLPDKYRGTARIDSTSANGTTVANLNGIGMAAAVFHVNYDRNAAISYDAIGRTAVALRSDAPGSLPCITLGFTNCAWAPTIYKTGTVSAQQTVVGVETGVRLMNVDPLLTGAPAQVVVVYIDDSGVVWDTASQRFVIPPFGVHTLFPLYDSQIPEIFRGTMRIMSTGNFIVGVANHVDYTVTDHDASGAYNLHYNTGNTR
jgi:hypothetical protein